MKILTSARPRRPTKPLYRKLILVLWIKSPNLWSFESYPVDIAEFSWCGWEDSSSINYLKIVQVSSLLTLKWSDLSSPAGQILSAPPVNGNSPIDRFTSNSCDDFSGLDRRLQCRTHRLQTIRSHCHLSQITPTLVSTQSTLPALSSSPLLHRLFLWMVDLSHLFNSSCSQLSCSHCLKTCKDN